MKTRTPDLLGMSYACANMVHSPGYADDLRQYTTLNSFYFPTFSFDFLQVNPDHPVNVRSASS